MVVRSGGIIDCTLREGDQAPGVWLEQPEKVELFAALDAAGVAVIDAGMPAISEAERQLLKTLAERPRQASLAASIRCREEEVRLALECGVEEVFIIYPVSVLHREVRLGLSRPRWLEQGHRVMAAARSAGLTVSVVMEDASRALEEDLESAALLCQQEGAHRVMICDTVGILTPARVATLIHSIRQVLGSEFPVGTHFHNDFGMATANTFAGLEAGALWPSVTLGGVGERAGNAPLAEVVTAARLLLGIHLGVAMDSLVPLTRLGEKLTGVFQGQAAPVVGATSFDHESGIHVHGQLKDASMYAGLDPTQVGRNHQLSWGKHSGRAGLVHLASLHGISDGPWIDEALRRLKERRPRHYHRAITQFLAARDSYLNRGRGVPEGEVVALLRACTQESM